MASRNIANMHLFLEMKKKFPYLPEDTLRGYVFLYSEDQNKCLSLLQKESDNLFHRSQQFSDFRLLENKNYKFNEKMKGNPDIAFDNENLNIPFQPNKTSMSDNSNINNNFCQNNAYICAEKSSSNGGAVHLPSKSAKLSPATKSESQSAPVLGSSERPFISIYKSIPESSHGSLNASYDQNYHNRMIFSTTKEHIIQPPEASNDIEISPSSSNADPSKKHAVKLSITPALPFHQQQMNVYSNSVSTSTSHSSRPGRHTTSVNFQLQPPSSEQYPIEITTIPTNIEKPCNSRDFGSHVQISVDAQGTTFTALRLQRPTASQNPSVDYSFNHQSMNESHFKSSQTSSQDLNSKFEQESSSVRDSHFKQKSRHFALDSDEDYNYSFNSSDKFKEDHKKELFIPVKFGHGFQNSPNYTQAVKKRQREQLKYIQGEINKGKATYSKLKSEIQRMEQQLDGRSFSSYNEVIKKLKEENRLLQLECNSLLMEYDLSSKGQIPVGVTDEDFYSNIFKGPNDDIALYSYNDKNASQEERISQSQTTEDEFDEKNKWKCNKCTFVNHPSLEYCELCEISKNSGSFFDDS